MVCEATNTVFTQKKKTPVYYMGSKQRARQVAQALKATAKAAKVHIPLFPKAPLVLTEWQVAQARSQDYQFDQTAAAANRAGISRQKYWEQSTFFYF